MDLALNNLHRLICHKAQATNIMYQNKDNTTTLTKAKESNLLFTHSLWWGEKMDSCLFKRH